MKYNDLIACVFAFAESMLVKLLRKRERGFHGWDSEDWEIEDIKKRLIEHVEKGDFVDVANFAMFAWNKGKSQ